MTEPTQLSTESTLINMLFDYGITDGMPRIAELLLNMAMLLERSQHLRAQDYERSDARTGYANGFKDKTLVTSIGKLNLNIPQVRNCTEPFYPSLLEKGTRFQKALKVSIAEMYLQGISTRKVTKVIDSLCGLNISSTQVSNLTSEIDEELTQWRNRPLPPIEHLILDATYLKVRVDSCVCDCAVLIAVGISRTTGKRMILGTSAQLSEAEIHWRTFLSSLKERGMSIPNTITSDAHEGLRKAITTVFPGVPWQRCQFHLQQNALGYVPKQSMKTQVSGDIRSIFDSRDKSSSLERLQQVAQSYAKSAPQLAKWLSDNIPQGLAIQDYPPKIRKKLRTSNMMENINKQIKRRTKVACLFPNTNSIERLVSALLQEISDEWETGRSYLLLDS